MKGKGFLKKGAAGNGSGSSSPPNSKLKGKKGRRIVLKGKKGNIAYMMKALKVKSKTKKKAMSATKGRGGSSSSSSGSAGSGRRVGVLPKGIKQEMRKGLAKVKKEPAGGSGESSPEKQNPKGKVAKGSAGKVKKFAMKEAKKADTKEPKKKVKEQALPLSRRGAKKPAASASANKEEAVVGLPAPPGYTPMFPAPPGTGKKRKDTAPSGPSPRTPPKKKASHDKEKHETAEADIAAHNLAKIIQEDEDAAGARRMASSASSSAGTSSSAAAAPAAKAKAKAMLPPAPPSPTPQMPRRSRRSPPRRS